MTDRDKLILAYKKIAELTNPKCSGVGLGACLVKNSCCSKEYCIDTMKWAKKVYSVVLPTTGNMTLPLMGPNGCTADPQYRPICSVHVCERSYMMDQKFATEYFRLRDEISELEYKINGELM